MKTWILLNKLLRKGISVVPRQFRVGPRVNGLATSVFDKQSFRYYSVIKEILVRRLKAKHSVFLQLKNSFSHIHCTCTGYASVLQHLCVIDTDYCSRQQLEDRHLLEADSLCVSVGEPGVFIEQLRQRLLAFVTALYLLEFVVDLSMRLHRQPPT